MEDISETKMPSNGLNHLIQYEDSEEEENYKSNYFLKFVKFIQQM